MLKLELPQKTRPPPAPAFSSPFTTPALKWARRKRHHHHHHSSSTSTALPHMIRRHQRQGRGVSSSSSPDPRPSGIDGGPSSRNNHPHSASPSPSAALHDPNKPPPPVIHPPTPRKEGHEDHADDTRDAAARRPPRAQHNEGVITRTVLGKPVILALPAASRDIRNGSSGGGWEARSLRPRVAASSAGGGGARQRRPELWVSLSREEIEEDYYSITGGKLPRRPKRRPARTLPPNLADRIFPGSWLPNTIMAEMYKVHDPAMPKRR